MEIIPERGAIVTELELNGKKVLYINHETLFDLQKNVRGGIPILFPLCGALEEGQYEWDGNVYSMKQHGFARNRKWKVGREYAGAEEASVTLELRDDEDTYSQYPFHFALQITYRLKDDGMDIQVWVRNEDAKSMPFNFGFHPYFYVPDKKAVTIEIPSGDYENVVPESFADGRWNFEKDEWNVKFQQLSSCECRLTDPSRSATVRLGWDDSFRYLVVWSLKDQPFICLEPWTAFSNSFHTKRDLILLKPGEEKNMKIFIKVDRL